MIYNEFGRLAEMPSRPLNEWRDPKGNLPQKNTYRVFF